MEKPAGKPKRMKKTFVQFEQYFYVDDDDDDNDDDEDNEDGNIDDDDDDEEEQVEQGEPVAIVAARPRPHCPQE